MPVVVARAWFVPLDRGARYRAASRKPRIFERDVKRAYKAWTMGYRKSLRHNYHDGGLGDFTIGPRREVVLSINLNPVCNQGLAKEQIVQISAIVNFEEVESFFRRISPRRTPDAYLDEVVALKWTNGGNIVIELARSGYVEVVGPKVIEI